MQEAPEAIRQRGVSSVAAKNEGPAGSRSGAARRTPWRTPWLETEISATSKLNISDSTMTAPVRIESTRVAATPSATRCSRGMLQRREIRARRAVSWKVEMRESNFPRHKIRASAETVPPQPIQRN